tara:strand:+ start:521 stop:1315 length:795 start_codon:yes stop_codon:yes gene_type:complete
MKKKVAICLRGAMSKIQNGWVGGRLKAEKSLEKLYTTSKKFVNFKAVYKSILIHIVNYNKDEYEFDFFIQSWNPELQKELIELYNPKKYIFEHQGLYKDIISNHTWTNLPNTACHRGKYGYCAQKLGICKSLKLVQEYSNNENVNYDLIIVYRPDVLLFKNMDLNCYDKNNVYINNSPDEDFHFIMNYKNSVLFSNMFDYKMTFKDYITNIMKVKVLGDDIKFGIHQEVLRTLKYNSIDVHQIPREVFYKYNLTDEELDLMTHE